MESLRLLGLVALLCAANAAAQSIELMVEDGAEPWSGPDGKGYANEVVRAAYAAVGIEVSLRVVPYARCKANVIRGLVAGCFSMSPAPELKGSVELADAPLFTVHPYYFARSGQPIAVHAEHDLVKDTRVGIVNGYEYSDALRAMQARGVVLDVALSEQANLRKLAAGRVDYAVIMLDPMKTMERMLNMAQVRTVQVAFAAPAQGSFVGFSTTHAQGERARALFNQGYRLISANGTKDRIESRWRPN